MSNSLAGTFAVATGGGSGIGRGIARRFIAAGASFIIGGQHKGELDEATRELDGNTTAVRVDILKLTNLDALYERVRKRFGRIHVLVADAGEESLACSVRLPRRSWI